MTTFQATTEGTDKLGLRSVLERYANGVAASTLLCKHLRGKRQDLSTNNSVHGRSLTEPVRAGPRHSDNLRLC